MTRKSKSLLFNDYTLIVSPKLATYIGLHEAIFLQQLHYWLINPRSGRKDKDGVRWIHNTYSEWQKNFPFWSTRTIIRIVNRLANNKLIIVKRVTLKNNETRLEYTINYDELDRICEMKDDSDYIEEDVDDNLSYPHDNMSTPHDSLSYPHDSLSYPHDNLSWGTKNSEKIAPVDNNNKEETAFSDTKKAPSKTTTKTTQNDNKTDKSVLLFPEGEEKFNEIERYICDKFGCKSIRIKAQRDKLHELVEKHDMAKLKEIIEWAAVMGWSSGKTINNIDNLAEKWGKERQKKSETKKKDIDLREWAKQWGK